MSLLLIPDKISASEGNLSDVAYGMKFAFRFLSPQVVSSKRKARSMPPPCIGESAHLHEPDLGRLRDDVMELSLLLPGWQLAALEKTARRSGQSAGEIVRRLVQKFLLENC
jgi:hypothetical protein